MRLRLSPNPGEMLLRFVGDRAALSDKVRAGLEHAEQVTAANTRLLLNVCFNYGGRWDIAQAAAQRLVGRRHSRGRYPHRPRRTKY